ncbi:MAG: glycan-binding surface protein [Bacteroidales bacterium]|nr:glycan-binding surface protein [Bacteroidales bacterium]
MQSKFIKYCNCALLFATLCMVSASALLTSCDREEEDDKVALYSFGPMPIARGAELKFIGKNLDKVTSIVLPDNITITTFTTKTADLLTITVPQEAVPGFVVLKTPDGDITTKTEIGFSEPISIASFSPATIKPNAELTITGDYLNLVGEVIFTDRIKVIKTSFTSQSRTEIKLLVPATAQTGKIAVSDSEEDPVIVYSVTNLTVKLPAFTTIAPNPVKAGTQLTITGTDLDLVITVTLGGNKNITTFVSKTATEIVLDVPADTKDGIVTLTPASGVKVESADELVMVVPAVSVTPTTLKNGADITVTGTDLDLVDKVTFGGDKQGTIKAGGTETQIVVTVPDDATSGVVTFITKAAKEVDGPSLTIIDPVFTSFSPSSGKANTDVTIVGTDLDIIADVEFFGGIKGTIGTRSETQLTVKVPIGANTGKIVLVAKNGTRVLSSADFTVLANLPNFTHFTESVAARGAILTLNGTNMDLIKSLVFPGDIVATEYGLKSTTQVQVYVPWNATIGYGKIKINTYEGEQGYVPPTSTIFIGGVVPVTGSSLIINDFDEVGHDLGWDNWNGISQLMNDGNGVSGKYLKGAAALNAWDWKWIWGCNHSQLPKQTANTATYVLKLDIKITAPISADASRFQFKLGGSDSRWVKLGLVNSDGNYATEGWVTVTFDLVNDLGFSGTIPGSGDWGMIAQPAAALDFNVVNIDNIRFEPK